MPKEGRIGRGPSCRLTIGRRATCGAGGLGQARPTRLRRLSGGVSGRAVASWWAARAGTPALASRPTGAIFGAARGGRSGAARDAASDGAGARPPPSHRPSGVTTAADPPCTYAGLVVGARPAPITEDGARGQEAPAPAGFRDRGAGAPGRPATGATAVRATPRAARPTVGAASGVRRGSIAGGAGKATSTGSMVSGTRGSVARPVAAAGPARAEEDHVRIGVFVTATIGATAADAEEGGTVTAAGFSAALRGRGRRRLRPSVKGAPRITRTGSPLGPGSVTRRRARRPVSAVSGT